MKAASPPAAAARRGDETDCATYRWGCRDGGPGGLRHRDPVSGWALHAMAEAGLIIRRDEWRHLGKGGEGQAT